MDLDNETWLIELGDLIINKESADGISCLNDIERAVYCLWVVDYSVRNAGDLGAVEDLYPDALSELHHFALTNQCSQLSLLSDPAAASAEEEFCERFHRLFDESCKEIRARYESNAGNRG